ncbi:uncharacterized protein LOC113797191 [Dermatophagoides pteronyssinus]|uniref:uncharacterized protein LOC113797191 n=1 Tax=Dermatophagoides pteronyssinus TaxID=6956 RepID=UPI003F665169
MDHTKLQPSQTTPVQGTVSATPTSIQAARPRFNLNNFILVPAGSTNILTNNGQMSNLIATNHNTIVNKGKIMILTTTPTLTGTGNATGTATGAQILTASHTGQSVQLRPSMVLATSSATTTPGTLVTPNISTFGNSTTATSIIANIKMNPVSNQPISNQIHQIATVPTVTASVSNALTIPANVMATNNNNIKQQPQAVQMLTPIVTPANLSGNNSGNNNRAHPHHQHLNFVSQNLTHRNQSPSSSITINHANNNNNNSTNKSTIHLSTGKTKTNTIQQASNNTSISTTPVILNTNNLFVTTPCIDGQQNQQSKSKPMINLNLIPSNHNFNINQLKNVVTDPQKMNVDYIVDNENADDDDDTEIKSIEEKQNGKRKKKNRHEKLFTDETLDRSSPELWPESVPGVVKFLANTSPYTSDDDDYDLSDDSPQKNGGKLDISNNSGTRNPTLINLSSIVKSEIFDDDDEYDDDEEDDDDSSLQNFGDNNLRYNKTNYNFTNSDNQFDGRNKIIKSFALTPYGLELANENEDIDDDSDSRATSPTESILTNSTNNNKTNIKSTNNLNNNNNNNDNKPEWQKGFNDEEISMLYGYGSLTSSALLDKVREIQNLSYQLGLEEESEIARARYLNILNENDTNDDNMPNLSIDSEIDNIFMSTKTKTTTNSNPISSTAS